MSNTYKIWILSMLTSVIIEGSDSEYTIFEGFMFPQRRKVMSFPTSIILASSWSTNNRLNRRMGRLAPSGLRGFKRTV